MSIQSILFNIGAKKNDRKRDSQIPYPSGIQEWNDISYGPYGKENLLDVYRPAGQDGCPIIVNIHGGGYVYGNKELYKRYSMDLARRGFAVVNINYRLAPKWKFPAPLEDINNAMHWINRESRWFGDITRIFMVGDSAGAQLASQYAAMLSNPEYMATFGFRRPDPGVRLRAVGLNGGLYDMKMVAPSKRKGLEPDYLGRKIPNDAPQLAATDAATGDFPPAHITTVCHDYLGRKISNDDPRLAVMDAITGDFPPAHITTACHDFLRDAAKPMYDFLTAKGIPCRIDCYGSEEDRSIGHVFHINIIHDEAIRCNDEQCDFFRQYL